MDSKVLATVICQSTEDLAGQAAADACEAIKASIVARGTANVLFSAGASQDEFYEALMAKEDVDWQKVVGFNDAEFKGKPSDDPQSARGYLMQKVVSLTKGFKEFHFINGAEEVSAECARLSALLAAHPIDVALLSIGERGEFGGNQLPANVETKDAFLLHMDVITMSVEQVLKSKKIVVAMPGKGHALVAKNVTEVAPSPGNPGGFLQAHPDACLYLDQDSANLLKGQLSKGQVAVPVAGAAPGKNAFVIRTFRPGQGWVEMGNEFGKGRNILSGKLDPMAKRKMMLEKKKAQPK